MIKKLKMSIFQNIKDYKAKYFLLLLMFVMGVSSGAFTVNGLSSIQLDELKNYFQGFLQLLDNQNVNNSELLVGSMLLNLKMALIIWGLGVTIIGIPFIYFIVGVRGYVLGFSSGFTIKILGFKGILFNVITMFPKEALIISGIIALSVSGINFSLNIVKRRSMRRAEKESLKSKFFTYCAYSICFSFIIFIGTLVEAYISPVLIRIFLPLFQN